MKKLNKAAAVFVCIIMMLPLASCGSAGSAESKKNSVKSITLASGAMEGTLDPAGDASSTFVEYAKLALDPLISFNDQGTLLYETAESYTTNSDDTVWTFKLRQNGKWSDGSAVTADDYINTIKRALAPDSNSMYASELYILQGATDAIELSEKKDDAGNITQAARAFDISKFTGAKAIDAYTLEFTLSYPTPYFLKLLALPVFQPSKTGKTESSKTWYQEPGNSLANGAFYLTEFKLDDKIVLKKNPNYWQADKVKLDEIVLKIITDKTAAESAYKTGEVDVASGLQDTVMETWAGKPDLYFWNMQTTVFLQFSMNNAPVFQDPKVRQAFALGINRQELCTAVGADLSPSFNFVANAMVSNASNQLFSKEVGQLFTEDLDKAKQLLSEAGYPNGTGFPKLKYLYGGTGKNPQVAEALQAQLKANLGVEIELQAVEMGVYMPARRSGDYELLRNSWTADYADPINYLALFAEGGGFARSAGISDPVYNEIVAASNKETDKTARNKLLHQAEQRLVAENFYVCPLYTQRYVGLRNPRITGLEKNDRDESMYRFVDIKD